MRYGNAIAIDWSQKCKKKIDCSWNPRFYVGGILDFAASEDPRAIHDRTQIQLSLPWTVTSDQVADCL